MTLIDASTMLFGWIRRRCLTSLLCSFDNGGASSICDRMVRNCAMTSSGAILAGSGFDKTGVVLLMTFLHYASCQAGGDVHDSSTSASGHRLEVSATRRFFRLMFSRGVYTPRMPAAGGASSTPAPVQV